MQRIIATAVMLAFASVALAQAPAPKAADPAKATPATPAAPAKAPAPKTSEPAKATPATPATPAVPAKSTEVKKDKGKAAGEKKGKAYAKGHAKKGGNK